MQKRRKVLRNYSRDVIASAAKALAQITPVSAAVEVFLSEELRRINQRKRTAFFERLKTGAVELTAENVKSEVFLERFLIALQAVDRSMQDEKVLALADLLKAGSLGNNALDNDAYLELAKIVEEISTREFTLLALIQHWEEEALASLGGVQNCNNVQFTELYWDRMICDLAERFKCSSTEIMAMLFRLGRTGCYNVEVGGGAYLGYGGGRGRLTYLWYQLRQYVTPPLEPN